jgi:alkylation response protein AidB-like acyl-CoA dehydrogenase
MSDSQASWQDRPYQQEATMTNPPSWGYDLAGGEAARFIELASREQAGIEQDEAGQALRSLGMTPSAEKPASGRPWPHRRRHVRAVRPGCHGAWPTTCPDAPVAVALATAYRWKVAVHAGQECVRLPGGTGLTWERPAHLYLTRAEADPIASGTPDARRAAPASLVSLPAP